MHEEMPHGARRAGAGGRVSLQDVLLILAVVGLLCLGLALLWTLEGPSLGNE